MCEIKRERDKEREEEKLFSKKYKNKSYNTLNNLQKKNINL